MFRTSTMVSKTSWKSKTRAMGVIVASLISISGPAAFAEDTSSGIGVQNALASVTSINDTNQTNDVLKQVAEVPTDAQGISAIDANVSGVSITLPTDPSNAIVMKSTSGVNLSIEIPNGSSSDNNVVLQNGAVAYDGNDGSSTAAIVKTDGSIQFSTVIANENAPSKYSYDFSSPSALTLTMDPQTGSVSVIDANGKWAGGLAPAWALDSDGKKVKTFYTVDGSSVTQHVDVTQPGITFPVVADPWLGITLVDHTSWITNPPVGPTLQVYPTLYARQLGLVSDPLSGISQLVADALWSEMLSKTATTGHPAANTATMKGQLLCHFYFVAKDVRPNIMGILKPSWNLDSNRPAGNLVQLLLSGCNI
jgi:hypothetical protein